MALSIEIVWSAKVFRSGEGDLRIEEVKELDFSAQADSAEILVKRLDSGLGDMITDLKARMREHFLPPVAPPRDQFERAARAWAADKLDIEETEVAKVEFSGECVGCYSCDYTPGSYEVMVEVTLRDGTRKQLDPGPLDLGEIVRGVLAHG